MAEILVGVDGSSESRRALQWAADRARITGASVHAVHVYETPAAPRLEVMAPAMASASAVGAPTRRNELAEAADRRSDMAAEADQLAQERLRIAVGALAGSTSRLEISSEAVSDPRPASVLVQRSRHADLLVVGSRGRGGFASLLLGSVSQNCAQHAHCPVVIVR